MATSIPDEWEAGARVESGAIQRRIGSRRQRLTNIEKYINSLVAPGLK